MSSTSIEETERSLEERAQRARGAVLALLFLAAAALVVSVGVVLLLLL